MTWREAAAAELRAALDRLRSGSLPVILPVFDNPTFTAGMIGQLRRFPALAPVVMDNGSTFPPMLRLLDDLERDGPVIRLGANPGPRFVLRYPGCLAVLPRHFVVTDPDLRLNPSLPQDFHLTLIALTERERVGKAGFALDISAAAELRDEAFHTPARSFTIRDHESRFWRTPIAPTDGGDPVYRAGIDTTFALYDRACFDMDHFFRAVRVAGRFTCQHLPWRRGFALPAEEEAHYRARQRHSTYLRAAAAAAEGNA